MPVTPPPSDPVSMVNSCADAAFATAEEGRILAWSPAAEQLLGLTAERSLGRPCHEIVSGVDVFGNRYCRSDCALREMVRCDQLVRGFKLDVRRASGEFVRVDISVVATRDSHSSEYVLCHLLLRPDEQDGVSRKAGRLA